MGRGSKKTDSFFFLFSAPALLAVRGSPLTARSFARRSFDRSKNARKRKRLLAVYTKCRADCSAYPQETRRKYVGTFAGIVTLAQLTDFSRNQIEFSRTLKFMINPFTSKISMFILLTVCHTFHIFALNLTYFQNFPGQLALFQDFLVLEKCDNKIQDFLGPVRTLFNNSMRCCIDRLIFHSKQNCESFTYLASHIVMIDYSGLEKSPQKIHFKATN